MTARIALVTLALSLLPAALAAPAQAKAIPTAVTVLRGDLDAGGSFTALVTIQRAASGRARVVAYRIDGGAVHNDGELYTLVLGRGPCSSKGPSGRPLLRFDLRADKHVELTRSIKPSALRNGASWYVVETGATRPEACSTVGTFAPFGAVTSLRDVGSGQATGLVAMRRNARAVRVTSLLYYTLGDTATHEVIGTSGRTCGDSFTATDDLWQWRKKITASLMVFKVPAWPFAETESLAIAPVDSSAGPVSKCQEWNDDWLAPK